MYGAKDFPYKMWFFFSKVREVRKRSKESFKEKEEQKDIHTSGWPSCVVKDRPYFEK